MIPDRYSKVVLTVIAACLIWICVRDVTLVKTAYASETMNVNVENWPNVQSVEISAVRGSTGFPLEVQVVD